MISVADDGVGLAEDRVLAGLGTQIVKTLVEGELRGKIEFLADKSAGTTVSVEVPLA